MVPIKSNLIKESCSPVSSNCVMWQGPNLPCIGLCTGDTVSDVIYRVADELCKIKDSFGLTDVDLTCLLNVCTTTPEPQKTLTAILNLVINKVCCVNDAVVALQNASTPDEPSVILASCFNVTNPQGVPLTELPVSEYAYQIGIKLCDISQQVADNTADIAYIKTQIANLPSPTGIPQATPVCISGNGVVPNTPADIDVFVEELEKEFCNFKTAIGTIAQITAVKAQCSPGSNLNTENQLSTGDPMIAMTGWVANPTNLAQTLKNLWLTVCDMRGAVKLIQDTCCKVSCADIMANFEAAYYTGTDSNQRPFLVLTLYFGGAGVNIPSSFYDCNQTIGNTLTVTDEHGHSVPMNVLVRTNPNSGGVPIGILDGTPTQIAQGTDYTFNNPILVGGDTLTITGDLCLTDGSTTCVKCINISVPYRSTSDCCTISANGEVTIIYKICETI